MRFAEKLRQLVGDANKSELARKASLSATAVSDYLQKGYIPRGDKALLLARALNVPLDWLLDDDRDWPPPKIQKPTPANLSHDELMEELARRYRHFVLNLYSALDTLNKVELEMGAVIMYRTPLTDRDWPAVMLEWASNVTGFGQGVLAAQTRYDARVYADAHHREMPGADRPVAEMNAAAVLERARAWAASHPHFGMVERYMQMRSDAALHPERLSELEAERLRTLERLRKEGAVQRVEKSDPKSTARPARAKR